ADVREFLKPNEFKPIRTSVRSPWQNGIAERWITSYLLTNSMFAGLAANTSLITTTTQPIGLEKTAPATRSIESVSNAAIPALAQLDRQIKNTVAPHSHFRRDVSTSEA